MSKGFDWRDYVDDMGDFELPAYLFRMNRDLMKEALDLGTLLSEDQAKLRAYKEQIKKHFKAKWLEIAQALEFFDLIVPCECKPNTYCTECNGSRYMLNAAISPDGMREIGAVFSGDMDPDVAARLRDGLVDALKMVENLDLRQM